MQQHNDYAVLIVHGAWQSGLGWQTVVAMLNAQGLPAVAPDLPGHGERLVADYRQINLMTYVDFIAAEARALARDYANVILLGHSLGGMIISQVAEYVNLSQLIYVAGFFPLDGESLIDIAKRSSIPGLGEHMVFQQSSKRVSLKRAGLADIFYNDCVPATQTLALERLQDQPAQPFFDNVHLTEKFYQLPKVYIQCCLDQTLDPKLQKSLCARLPCSVYTLKAGHSPYYSMPNELAKLINRVIHR